MTFFSFSGGQDHFNDKPMITADTNLKGAFRDNVYVAWDAASGGSGGGEIRVAHSADHGGAALASLARTVSNGPAGRSARALRRP